MKVPLVRHGRPRMGRLLDKCRSTPQEARASVAYTACSVLQKGISVITLPVFTRLLTTAQYGQVSVYAAWASFLSIFVSLNLPYGSFGAAMANFPDERDRYVASVEGIFVALAIAFLAAYLPLRGWWNALFGLSTPMVLVMVAEVVAGSCLQCWMSRNRFEYRWKPVVAATVTMSLLSPVLSVALVLSMEDGALAKVLGGAVVTVAFGLVVGMMALRRGGPPFDRRFWRWAFGFNVPLVTYYLAQAAFNQSDRVMIAAMCGESEAGMYSVAYTLGMLLTFVADAVGSSYVPWFYARLEAGEERADRPVAFGIAAGLAAMLLLVVALAPELMLAFAGDAYSRAVYVVPPVAVSVLLLFYVRLFDRVLFLWRRRVALVVSAVVAATANIGLNLVLIPVFGYLAAGWTTLAAFLLFAAAELLFARREAMRRGCDAGMWDLPALGGLFAATVAAAVALTAAYPWPVLRLVLVVAAFLTAFLARRRIAGFVGKLRDGAGEAASQADPDGMEA